MSGREYDGKLLETRRNSLDYVTEEERASCRETGKGKRLQQRHAPESSHCSSDRRSVSTTALNEAQSTVVCRLNDEFVHLYSRE